MGVEVMECGRVAVIARAFGIRHIAFRVVDDAPYETCVVQPQTARVTGLFTVSFLPNLAPLQTPASP